MELIVYRLRFMGGKLSRNSFTSGVRYGSSGCLRFYKAPFSMWGRDVYEAELIGTGNKQALPALKECRLRVTEQGILISGLETVYRATKDRGATYRQTWLCVKERFEWDWMERNSSVQTRPNDASTSTV